MIFLQKVIIFIALVTGVFLLLLGLMREEKVTKHTDKIKKVFQSSPIKEGKRYIYDYFPYEWAKKMDDTFKYSRFFTKSKKLSTSISYFLFSNIMSFTVAIAVGILAHRFRFIVLIYVLGMVLFYGYLFSIRKRNQKSVNNDTILFLNLLGNYSTGNTEATSVFMQIAPKMNEPLRSCLVECVAESQDNSARALQNLQNKIESKKFNEIIKSIAISQQYSGSFQAVVVQNRATIQSFIKAQKERRELAMQNTINMSVCSVALVMILVLLSSLVEQNVVMLLFTTTLGNIVLLIALACLIYFIIKVVEVSV